MTERPSVTNIAARAVEVAIFAPIGLIDLLRHDGPRLVDERRRSVEHQVRTAHMIGKMSVAVARTKMRQRAEPATPGTQRVSAPAPRPEEPFAGYDSLPAAEVVALLERLRPDEIDRVRSYEAATRARRTVLAKVDQLSAA
ncbi:MAG: hypothetical protein ACKOA2_03260 [Ilumatobacteraceae bacterium]